MIVDAVPVYVLELVTSDRSVIHVAESKLRASRRLIGAFPYSHEPGTPAGERFGDDVSPAEKARRLDRLMRAQQQIAFAHARSLEGRTLPVLIDGLDPEGRLIGRTPFDAPEIDPHLVVTSGEASPGELVEARVTGAEGYDLLGEICG